MQHLEIPKIKKSDNDQILFPNPIHSINKDNWNYSAEMVVKFGIAYDKNHFYIQYLVRENHPKAITTEINGPVWEDSCVEFFINFNDNKYYNIEVNCIGTQLCGYGESNTNRQCLDKKLVASIKTSSSLGSEPIDIHDLPTKWTLNIIIPTNIFIFDNIELARGQEFNANFYKCGDKQKHPHFLSWNAIDNPKPNFHLPKYFGKLKLV